MGFLDFLFGKKKKPDQTEGQTAQTETPPASQDAPAAAKEAPSQESAPAEETPTEERQQ